MNLLQRYIFGSVLGSTAASVGMFAFVLIVGNMIRDLLAPLASGQLSPGLFGRMLLLLVPFVVSYALPLGILAGTLLVLGRLSANREIVAMRSAGLSLYRIASPILFLAVLGVAAAVIINFYYAPNAKSQYRALFGESVRADPMRFIVQKTFIRDFPNYVLYIGEKDGSEMGDFWIWELDEQERVVNFIRAESGRFSFDEERSALILTLRQAQAELRNPENPEDFTSPRSQLNPSGEHASIMLSLEKILGRSTFRKKLSWMNFNELIRERERTLLPSDEQSPEQRLEDRMKVQITIQEKFAMAFSILSFTLVGIPLGVRMQRKETSANLGLALALAMTYYFLIILIGWLDKWPELRPDLLMWIPNLAFQGLGVWLFARAEAR